MSSESATESERAKWRSTGLIIAKQDMSDLIAGRLFVLGRIVFIIIAFFQQEDRRTKLDFLDWKKTAHRISQCLLQLSVFQPTCS